MTTTTQNRASLEYEQKLSTVVSFLETVFKPDEQLPSLGSDLIDDSIWYKSLSLFSHSPKVKSGKVSFYPSGR